MELSTHKTPTFESLFVDDETVYKADKFLQLINRPVPRDWVKVHPFINQKDSQQRKVPYYYLPIDKVEFLLARMFGAFRKIEVLREQVMFNSIAVTVRIHYCIPETSVWMFQDGCGAAPVDTEKGQPASNMAAILANGVQKGFPSAYSYAVSNAAAKIGKVFGGDLNKDDALEFTGRYSSTDQSQAAAPQPEQFYAPAPAAPAQPAAWAPAPPAATWAPAPPAANSAYQYPL